ncbi:MAG: sporulation protein YunB [Tissierellales bacterium]
MILIIYTFNYIDKNIRPSIIAISEIKAKQVTTQAINNTIKTKIKNDIDYEDLIFVHYDNEGKVTLMQANTMLMNSVASEVALEVQNELKQISESTIKVPLNNAFNTDLIRLPSINIQIIPQGSVIVDFATEFESTGINQTRHRVYIIVTTDVKLIVPLVSENITITTNIPIAETIIVGEVPEQYINVPEDEILNLVN